MSELIIEEGLALQELYDREQKWRDIEELGIEIMPTWFMLEREFAPLLEKERKQRK